MHARKTRNALLGAALAALCGCGLVESRRYPDYVAIEPIVYPEVTASTAAATGSLYAGGPRAVSLFTDVRAHRIGDIVSVLLTERTSAAKSADTELSKDTNINIEDPNIFGQPVTIKDRKLGVAFDSGSAFEGEASSNQSNSLRGAIAVQVARVLPNGNLFVQGEKWIKINQGDEYLRLSGVIRPEDVSPTNTIPSTRVADARIAYGGAGVLNESNKPGWLSRFFMSPLLPF